MSLRARIVLPLLLASVQARDIPSNVQRFYDSVIAQGSCNKPLQTGFYDMSPEIPGIGFAYCGDHVDDYGIIYIQGGGGKLANMDTDCDGDRSKNDNGGCDGAHSVQSATAMRDYVSAYSNGVSDLNPFVHDYVVFGNSGDKAGWITFDPRDHNMKPLSVMAVVCNNQLIYGIWGDTNGDDGVNPRVGEASISIANLCFGSGFDLNGDVGQGILYIGFTGDDAVPGEDTNWGAADENEFQSSIRSLGDRLIQRIGGSTNSSSI
ncbi:glycoside hydrolase family 75 protein [Hypoxylon sp. FL1857]|nr:glycoside hydrolase family 75 protein [Hypoxylon sp. FL1857]